MRDSGGYKLYLLGAFRLIGPDGQRIALPSKRGQALIALLALAGGGERARPWLQDRLWGARSPEQGMASLRRELSNLKALVNRDGAVLLAADGQRAWLDLALVSVDLRELAAAELALQGELLEGLDLAGSDEFEEWLRAERGQIAARIEAANQQAAAAPAQAPQPSPSNAEFARLPALAVLPFANQTGDDASDHVAEGLSEDLIDRLAALRWLPVIARSSSLAVLAEGESARAAALRLGARYAVEGRLRRAQDTLTLAISLIDAGDGTQLWSSRSALPVGAAHALVAELIAGLVAALGGRIEQQEQAIALRQQPGGAAFHDLIWRGKWHLNRLTRADAAAARACFTQAAELEPSSAEAIIQLAWVQLWDLWVGRADDAATRAARKLAQRAVIADGEDARGYMLSGIAELWLRQPLRAQALLERAVQLNPSLVMARVQLGVAHYLRGDPRLALEHLQLALRLSPNDNYLFFTNGEIAQSYLMLEDYGAALDHAERALQHRSGYWMPYVIQINALIRLGRAGEAQSALAELRQMRPDFTPDFCDWTPFLDPRWNHALKQGLNLAGA